MIDQLIQLAKEQLGGQLQQAGLNSAQINPSMEVAKDTVVDGIKSEAMSGGLDNLLSLFNGKAAASASNPFVSSLITKYAGNLISKLGLSPQVSQTVSQLVIPTIMQLFAKKETGTANSAGDLMSMLGMDKDKGIASILGNLGGGKGGDILGGLGKIFGGKS